MKPNNRRLLIIGIIIIILLLIPLIAMQFTNEVNWSAGDFGIFTILLLAAALLCEIVSRRVKSRKSRIILSVIIILLFVLVWAEIAVGVFSGNIH